MKNYAVQDREAGNFIDWVDSLAEGELLIKEFERKDMDEGIYTPDFYECVKVEHYPHLIRLRDEW
jgi:hypothetical protein